MWEGLIEKDHEWFLYLNQLGTPAWDPFWLFLSDKWAAIPLYVLLLILAYRRLGWKRLMLFLVFIGVLITSTDQLSGFFKYGVQRLRPCHEPEFQGLIRLVKQGCGGRFGYFSAHAANSFALATFFAVFLESKRRLWAVLLILWALMVGYSRIYLGVHYPLDVLSGCLAGGMLGWLFARLYLKADQNIFK
jgi:undecaprenyl-diphosphatase